MNKKEKQIASEYVDYIYNFLKMEFGKPDDVKPENTGEKLALIEEMFSRMTKQDVELNKLLDTYHRIHNLRIRVTNAIKEHIVVLRAIFENSVTPEIRKMFYEKSENRIAYAQQLCEKTLKLIKQVQQPESHKHAEELIEYIRDNHALMEERLQVAIEFLKKAKEELEKMKPTIKYVKK